MPAVVSSILEDRRLWGSDLSRLQRFGDSVAFYAENLDTNGFFRTLQLPDPARSTNADLSLTGLKK